MIKDSPSILLMCLVFSNITSSIIFIFYSNSIITTEIFGELIPFWNGITLYYAYFMFTQSMFFVFTRFYKIWKYSSKELRKNSKSVVIGTIILTFGTFIVSFTFNILYMILVASTGIIILANTFTRNLPFLYRLPFKVNRLIIIDRESGLTLFNYSWNIQEESSMEEILTGGLLKALDQLSETVLRKGTIQEIKLKEGNLILNTTSLIMVGLLSSQSSTHLKESLAGFVQEFESQFRDLLETDNRAIDKYLGAEELIFKYFANISKSL